MMCRYFFPAGMKHLIRDHAFRSGEYFRGEGDHIAPASSRLV